MDDNTVRLDKYLANLGLCSRRNIKSLLKEQNLTVNGKRIRESGYRINLIKDVIRLNDKKIKKPTFVYYLFNKPKNVISTTSLPVSSLKCPVGRPYNERGPKVIRFNSIRLIPTDSHILRICLFFPS